MYIWKLVFILHETLNEIIKSIKKAIIHFIIS